MSKHRKLLDRLASNPKDFTWSELVTLLGSFGYELTKGSGSRRKFNRTGTKQPLYLHEPHPSGTLKSYAVKQVVEYLVDEGDLSD